MPTKKKIELINPKREPLTPEKPRELSGLNLSDEQAEEVISSLSIPYEHIYLHPYKPVLPLYLAETPPVRVPIERTIL